MELDLDLNKPLEKFIKNDCYLISLFVTGNGGGTVLYTGIHEQRRVDSADSIFS